MRNKQQNAQIALVLIGILLILMTYFYYPYTKKAKLIEGQPTQKGLKDTSSDEDTTFENVEYKGLYDLDKPFTIKSQRAHILSDEPDIVHMAKMHAILHLKDGRIVNITSDKGKYNKVTYDCFFEQNVEATDGETKIFSENLDLLATVSSAEIYNDVILNYPTGSFLTADKINYDFETKYFNVSMFDDKAVKMKLIE